MLFKTRLAQVLVLSHVAREVHDVDAILVVLVELIDVVSQLLFVPDSQHLYLDIWSIFPAISYFDFDLTYS